MSIQFIVTSVSHASSSVVSTVKKGVRTSGAEWETVEFQMIIKDDPEYVVGNVAADAYFDRHESGLKIIINHPDLFGKYSVGDIVALLPITKN